MSTSFRQLEKLSFNIVESIRLFSETNISWSRLRRILVGIEPLFDLFFASVLGLNLCKCLSTEARKKNDLGKVDFCISYWKETLSLYEIQ